MLKADFLGVCLVGFGSKGRWVCDSGLVVLGWEEMCSSETDVLVRRSHPLFMSKTIRHQPYYVARLFGSGSDGHEMEEDCGDNGVAKRSDCSLFK